MGKTCNCQSGEECGCDEGHDEGGCSCGCGGSPMFQRRFLTKAEQIADLEDYLAACRRE